MGRKTVEMHLDVGVVAALLGGVGRHWVRLRVKEGELEGFMLGNKLVISAESVNRYLDKARVTGPKE